MFISNYHCGFIPISIIALVLNAPEPIPQSLKGTLAHPLGNAIISIFYQ